MKWVLRIAFGLAILLTAVVLAAPWLARKYIERTYPEVSVDGDIEVNWAAQTITLNLVHLDYPHIEGDIGKVVADAHKTVNVSDGIVTVTLGKTKGGGGSGFRLLGERMDLTVIQGDILARMMGSSISETEVCFREASVLHPMASATTTTGCVARDKSHIFVSKIHVPVELPFHVPTLSEFAEVNAFQVDVDLKTMSGSASSVWFVDHEDLSFGLLKVQASKTDEDVTLSADSFMFDHPWLGEGSIIGAPHTTVPLALLRGEHVGEVELGFGKARVFVNPFERSVRGEEDCGDWIDALPVSTPATLRGARPHFSGKLGFEVQTKPKASFKVTSSCRFKCTESPVRELRGKFDYQAYGSDGKRFTRTTGPGSGNWTAIQDLAPHIPRAFILLEDPGFESHKGVLPGALENSLKLNLETGMFSRGGSTITMQLAKNLWLDRSKTITRKAEEALLTYALESCLTKAQILEAYLNVVEFGPNTYGISEGSKYRFKRPPSQLTPEEAVYMASILPSPRKALAPEQGGLDKARRIMKMLSKSGFLSEYLVEDDDAPLDAEGWDVNL